MVDYLKIFEDLKIIQFDSTSRKYSIISDRERFDTICHSIPSSVSLDCQNFDRMSGIEFENFCLKILEKNGFNDLSLTKASGDHGVDIFASKNDVTYAIQCKCYSSAVGNAAIQQALSGKEFYKKDIAVVLTNSLFTPQAQREAKVLGVKLWNRTILKEMINQ